MVSKTLKLAAFIKEERLKRKLSQAQLSNYLGLKNGQFLYNIEKGRCGFPPKKLAKLSIALMVPLEQLKHLMIQDYVDTLNEEVSKSL